MVVFSDLTMFCLEGIANELFDGDINKAAESVIQEKYAEIMAAHSVDAIDSALEDMCDGCDFFKDGECIKPDESQGNDTQELIASEQERVYIESSGLIVTTMPQPRGSVYYALWNLDGDAEDLMNAPCCQGEITLLDGRKAYCTRMEGHGGSYVAMTVNQVCAIWAKDK